MPKSINDDIPKGLRPFRDMGIVVPSNPKEQVYVDCPFCGKEGKFSIHVESTQWRCLVCNEGYEKKDAQGRVKAEKGGTAVSFLKMFWKYCDEQTSDYAELATDRGLLSPETFIRWEVVKNYLTGEWLVPGYSITGKLIQLYRFVNMKKGNEWKRRLIPCSAVGGHALFGMNGFDKDKPIIDVHESPWNGMAVEEVMIQTGEIFESNIIAISGCAALEETWYNLFYEKHTRLWFDNDHPREFNGHWVEGAGPLYAKKALIGLNGIAKPVEFLQWGEGNNEFYDFDPALPNGHDVRDVLRPLADAESRSKALA